DPRLPFAIASVGLAIFAFALARAEQHLEPLTVMADASRAGTPLVIVALFAFAMLLFGVGFPVPFSLNSAAAYLRVATADQLPKLMPVFWVGFNLAMLPASLLPKRYGGLFVVAMGGALGVAALFACSRANTLEVLIAAQVMAGVAWAVTLM